MKTCTKCNKQKSEDEFYKDSSKEDLLRPSCIACDNALQAVRHGTLEGLLAKREQGRNYNKSPRGVITTRKAAAKFCRTDKGKAISFKFNQTPKGRFNRYKSDAKRRGIPFDLSFSQFTQFWQKPCCYCGCQIATIGLDRLISSKGYNIDNVAPCCPMHNKMKLAMTREQFFTACKAVVDSGIRR